MDEYKRDLVVKWAIYVAAAIVFSVVETRLMPHIRVFGVSPGFGAALTVAVAMYEGAASGAVFGLVCGALEYLSPGNSELIYMLVYMLGGYAAGAMCSYMFNRSIVTAFLGVFVLNTVAVLLYFVFMIALPRHAGLSALATAGVAEILMSTAVTPVVYLPVKAVARRWNATE